MTPEIIEVYVTSSPQIIEVQVPGLQGPAGLSTIGGFSLSVSNLVNGDLLGFNGSNWINRSDTDVTDGGNY